MEKKGLTIGLCAMCLVSCSEKSDETISVSCSILENVSAVSNAANLVPESRRSTQTYVFRREKLETGYQFNDFTQAPPILHSSNQERKLVWVVDINGVKFKPINNETKNYDGSSRNEDMYISVDNNIIGYNRTNFSTYKDGKKSGQITTLTINRLTGELVGEDQLFDTDNQFHTEILGKCVKASQKF
jgi:hypothetical protein